MNIKSSFKYLSKRILAKEKPFGDYLFGEGLGLPSESNPEPDTPEEWQIYNLTQDFIKTEFGREIRPILVEKLKYLKKHEDLYPEVLKPETNVLYRGVTLFNFDLYLEEDQITDKKISVDGEDYYYVGKETYKARSEVQSWTPDLEVAKEFSYNNTNFDKLEVIYKATIPYDQLLFNSKKFNDHEKEILRLSRQPLEVEVYISEASVEMIRKGDDEEEDLWD